MVAPTDAEVKAAQSGAVDLATLLTQCLQELPVDTAQRSVLANVDSASSTDRAALCRAFLAGGVTAVQRALVETPWVQVNVTPNGKVSAETYQHVAATARDLLQRRRVRNFFFMHKPPGMRLRFEPTDASEATRAGIVDQLRARTDLFAAISTSVYEPESYLFGGPNSMSFAHDTFTADSLAWLDQHVWSARSQDAGEPGDVLPNWAVSLLLARALVDGLGIVGWEHRGVWDTIRREGGRCAPAVPETDQYRRALDGIRAEWDSGTASAERLPHERCAALSAHREAVRAAAENWRERCFDQGATEIGPRRAAAYWIIFHWNRAALPMKRQCLLVDALVRSGGT